MTPGTYLRLRRQAAGLSLADVALQLACEPRYPAHSRAEWLDMIEADAAPLSLGTACALAAVRGFRFDGDVLAALIARAADQPVELPAICRSCACSWYDACQEASGGCAWVEGDENLCTACANSSHLARDWPASDRRTAGKAPSVVGVAA